MTKEGGEMDKVSRDRMQAQDCQPWELPISRRGLLRGVGLGALGIAAGGVLAACGSSTTSAKSSSTAKPPTSKGQVLASVPSYDNAYFTMWRRGGREAAEALGINYIMQSYEGSPVEQDDQLVAAKAAGATQVVAFPIDNGATPKLGKTLAKEHIYLCTAFDPDPWVVPSDPEFDGYYTSTFLATEVEGQKQLSLAVFKKIGNKGNVIYIKGSPTDLTSILRERGFDLAVKETPGIKVLAKKYGYEAEAKTAPVIAALLSKFPNVDAVVCHNSSEALAVDAALSARGMTHVKVGSTDEEVAILDQLIHGPTQVAVRAIFGIWTGGYMVVRNFDAAHGVKLNPVERMIDQDSVVLDTKESGKLFKEIGFERSTSGYDWKGMSRALNPKTWDPQNGMKPLDPTTLFKVDLGKPEPAGFHYPSALAKALSAGDIAKYEHLYLDRVKSSSFAPAIAKTTTGRTVLGLKY
jgi:ribose transport system substrate-binding protein